VTDGLSTATGQVPVGDGTRSYPLSPPLTTGDPEAETPRPLTVAYEYGAVDTALFDRPVTAGLDRWAPLLPPLAGQGLGAGGTPLLPASELASWAGVEDCFVKDESRNPTWSHKDRLVRVATAAAVRENAAGIVPASTGNHGAAAAAHAARLGLPCVVFTTPDAPAAMESFVRSYGAGVVRVGAHEQLVRFVDAVADRGFHPVTSRTDPHTGHPFGPEGYKPIAYELYAQLGRVPGAVAAPTAFAELLYGVWKGFRELRRLGVTDDAPRMVACEPAEQAALAAARDRDEPVVRIDAGPSQAHSIGGAASTHRGYLTLAESDGVAVPVSEETLAAAQDRLAGIGLWQEFSAAAGVGGLRAADATFDGPVVALACSSGFKDGTGWTAPQLAPDADVDDAVALLDATCDLALGPLRDAA
jgi:threonine synthase